MANKILRAAQLGIGGNGRGHLSNYNKFTAEGDIIKLVAVCDIDPEKFGKANIEFNLEEVKGDVDFEGLHLYTDYHEMIEKENLDLITISLPTYLHHDATVDCLNAGINVLCEKPMGLNKEECLDMIECAKKNNKLLMIGQCLRFWDEYVMLKKFIDEKTYGDVVSAYLYRGGATPKWSYQNWYMHKELGGGAIYDQHIHDVDAVSFLFGMPDAVSTLAKNVIKGSSYDMVSTNYFYKDSKVVNTQNDWTFSGLSFFMGFKVNFTEGTVIMDPSTGFTAAHKGEKMAKVEIEKKTNAYYNETRYFAECILGLHENTVNPPEDSMRTIELVHAEINSARHGGAKRKIK